MRGIRLLVGPCSYLPDREFHAFQTAPFLMDGAEYRDLMDLRFRRSGDGFYAPACPTCDACQPIRVDIPAFQPRKCQRRCWKRSEDLTVSWSERGLDDDRFALFERYQQQVHGRPSTRDDATALFLESGGVAGGELHARDGSGRLVAVSSVDLFPDALSSVYCYYDPSMPERSLGTFMLLAELQLGEQLGLRWNYLGFFIRGCRKMEYKGRFYPHEILVEGAWVRHEKPDASPSSGAADPFA